MTAGNPTARPTFGRWPDVAPRPRRRGTIVPPSGKRATFLARLSLGLDPSTGQRVRLNRGFATRKEAEQWLTSQMARADVGTLDPSVGASRLTLGDWLEEWAEVWSRGVSPRTREKALESFGLYLTPALRARPLRALTPADVQRRLQELLDSGKGAGTVDYLFRALRARLSDAVQHGRLGTNPLAAGRVRAPKVQRKDYRTLTEAEAAEFLALAESDRYGALWAMLLLTGLRPEEALALRWEDVEGNTLGVRRALVRTKGGRWECRETKTGRVRAVPLPSLVARLLTRHRADQARARLLLRSEYAGHALVFASGFGAPLQWPTVVARHFKPLRDRLALRMVGQDDTPPRPVKGQQAERAAYRERVEAALGRTGLGRFRAYDLRHTAATLMIARGVNAKAVADILGHASVEMTLKVYTHPSASDLAKALGGLEEGIARARRGIA